MDTQLISVAKRAKKGLAFKDALHLTAAEYWLDLGEIEEAKRELDRITRRDPDVTQLKKKLEAYLERLDGLIPDEVIALAD